MSGCSSREAPTTPSALARGRTSQTVRAAGEESLQFVPFKDGRRVTASEHAFTHCHVRDGSRLRLLRQGEQQHQIYIHVSKTNESSRGERLVYDVIDADLHSFRETQQTPHSGFERHFWSKGYQNWLCPAVLLCCHIHNNSSSVGKCRKSVTCMYLCRQNELSFINMLLPSTLNRCP